MTTEAALGVIGGSGLYDMEGLTNKRWERIDSPFGETSDEFLFGEIGGKRVVFCPRHGRGHRLPPSEINFRANIDALKRAGCTEILSLSAVGSLKEELAPGTFVVIDQFIDRTFNRVSTFFGPGLVAHVSMAHPVCRRLGDAVEAAAAKQGIHAVRGGTYIAMEGPQFSSQAECAANRALGADVIGMTNMPEAKLAREAEMCYATVAMVTDYDCWHPEHEHVSVEAVIGVLLANADHARGLVAHAAPALTDGPDTCPEGCHHALEHAIITAPEARDPAMVQKLDAVAGRMLGGAQG